MNEIRCQYPCRLFDAYIEVNTYVIADVENVFVQSYHGLLPRRASISSFFSL